MRNESDDPARPGEPGAGGFPILAAQGALSETIALEESRDLNRLEAIVADGLQSFLAVGDALAQIRDRKLYRIEHATFDEYLETKWKISRSRACRLIQAAETVKTLPTGNKPTTERQARPLTKLPRTERAEAWTEAVVTSPTGAPTAKEVEAVVEKMKQKTQSVERADHESPLDARPLPPEHKTPLQWASHFYTLLDKQDRQQFRNFQRGIDGAT